MPFVSRGGRTNREHSEKSGSGDICGRCAYLQGQRDAAQPEQMGSAHDVVPVPPTGEPIA